MGVVVASGVGDRVGVGVLVGVGVSVGTGVFVDVGVDVHDSAVMVAISASEGKQPVRMKVAASNNGIILEFFGLII